LKPNTIRADQHKSFLTLICWWHLLNFVRLESQRR